MTPVPSTDRDGRLDGGGASEADADRDGRLDGGSASVADADRFGGGPTESRALMKAHRALAWMGESVRRSLARVERAPPGHGQKAVRARYADLAGRVARSAAALGAASESRPLPWFEAVALLATVYRLEKELNDADEERDRLTRQRKEQPAAENRTACCIL